uniref:Nucleolar protein 6 putative n=1 Tax=Albugo laibachii Nc14 TaxID=890382 RepID=F0W8W9_9STRA|nr:nucleolar protein 6 putative [Albugo laibachii Nc14]|eukprot:CCA17580.1 nucleolar protein 6 putative [Albugo laibachii Nc14]
MVKMAFSKNSAKSIFESSERIAKMISTSDAHEKSSKLRGVPPKYALPNDSELHHLHAADPNVSYRSSFFRLQIDTLLQSICDDQEGLDGLQKLLFDLKTHIESIDKQQVTEKLLQVQGLPIHNHIKRKEIVLAFQKPSRIDIIGNFILKNSIKSSNNALVIDITVEIPSSCFVPKDFKDFRYADKRKLYLGVLVSKLEIMDQFVESAHLAPFRGEYEKPIAVVRIQKEALRRHKITEVDVQLRLIPSITMDTFKLGKLAPSRSNIRHCAAADSGSLYQTPLYNNAILEDMMFRRHTRELHVAMKSPSFTEACRLVKVWVRQREFDKEIDSINGFLLCMLLLYLQAKQEFSAEVSSEQMVKVLMHFVTTLDFEKQSIAFTTAEDGVEVTGEGMRAFQAAFQLVFLDSSGRYNLFGRISHAAWAEIQMEAWNSLHLMQSESIEDFRQVFIHRSKIWTRYDQFCWIPAVDAADIADAIHSAEERHDILDMGLERFWKNKVQALLHEALSNRVTSVRAVLDVCVEWKASDAVPPSRKVVVGLRIDPANAWRLVDRGPPNDDKVECVKYRQLWKGLSDVRRFKDGSIVESVVWDGLDEKKHMVIDRIVRYIIHAHYPHVQPQSISSSNQYIQTALHIDGFPSDLAAPSNLHIVFSNLCKLLRDLDSLPLQISGIIPVHPSFRNTNLYPLQQHPLAYAKSETIGSIPFTQASTVLEPLTIHLHFEKSSSWPTEIEALQHCKTGFYVNIANELQAQYQMRCAVATDCVDVITTGYAFRLVVRTERELAVIAGAQGPRKLAILNSPKYIETKRETEYLPKHANKIHALSTRFTAFGPTVRLLQRWLCEKCLSNSLRIEVVELLVAYVFINSSSTTVPQSIVSGLLKSLRLISDHDWRHFPLLVDFDTTLDKEGRREIHKRFDASRSSPSTHPALYIASDYEDMDCLSSWTRFEPERVVLQRLVSMAGQSHQILLRWFSRGCSSTGWKQAFRLPEHDFDAAIQLHLRKLPSKRIQVEERSTCFSAPTYKNLDLSSVPVMIGFDPFQMLLSDLQSQYKSIALFFVNDIKRDVIHITWKPATFLPAKFRAIASNELIPLPQVDGSGDSVRTLAVPNMFQLLSEIQSAGGDMIESIKLKISRR